MKLFNHIESVILNRDFKKLQSKAKISLEDCISLAMKFPFCHRTYKDKVESIISKGLLSHKDLKETKGNTWYNERIDISDIDYVYSSTKFEWPKTLKSKAINFFPNGENIDKVLKL